MADIKQCPYCAEDIKAAAIVCKHCGREQPDYDSKIAEIIKPPAENGEIKGKPSPKSQKNHPASKESRSNEDGHTFAIYWQRSSKLGIVIALLSLVAIPAGRLGIYNAIVDSPSVQQAFLGSVVALTLTGTILNYLITRLSYASIAFVWSKPSNRPIIGILALVIVLLSSGNLIGNSQQAQIQASATNTPWGSSATVSVSRTPGNSFSTGISTLAAQSRTEEATSPEQDYISNNQCEKYSDINASDIGDTLCVYGTVYEAIVRGNYYVVYFSGNQSNFSSEDFRFAFPIPQCNQPDLPPEYCQQFPSPLPGLKWRYLTVYEDIAANASSFISFVQPGHCVAATGEITRFESFSFPAIHLRNTETYLIWLSPNPCE